jgi:hypothetical protein
MSETNTHVYLTNGEVYRKENLPEQYRHLLGSGNTSSSPRNDCYQSQQPSYSSPTPYSGSAPYSSPTPYSGSAPCSRTSSYGNVVPVQQVFYGIPVASPQPSSHTPLFTSPPGYHFGYGQGVVMAQPVPAPYGVPTASQQMEYQFSQQRPVYVTSTSQPIGYISANGCPFYGGIGPFGPMSTIYAPYQ